MTGKEREIDMENYDTPLKAPFPYFGGKSCAAQLIWSRLGADCGNYAEPFFGSGAVWLNRPNEFSGWSVVNDIDGNVCNLWRSMRANPDAVAEAACQPVNECDLHARHLWLVNNAPQLVARLMADHEYCDPRTAGWWAWGACMWIGGGWCAGDGPWHAEPDADGVMVFVKGNTGDSCDKRLPHLGDAGRGVNRQLPHLGGGRGVNRKLPHLGGGTGVNRKLPHLGGGRGVNRKLPHLGDAGTGVNRKLPHLGAGKGVNSKRLEWLTEWFNDLSAAMEETRVCCGDWERICSPGTLTRNGVCAVLLDPPYSQTKAVYAKDSSTVSGEVRRWCIANGGNKMLRIALCGHAGEHEELETLGWTVETWDKPAGYQGADDRERIWFSPFCLQNDTAQLTLGI